MRFPKDMLKTGLFGSLLCLAALTPSCTNDDIPSDSYYTFTGQTVGQYLTAHAEDYSDFVQLLNRSYVSDAGNGSTLMEMLNAYGYYTCFAPDNKTMAKYLAKEGLSSIEEVSDSAAQVLTLMSIVSSASTVYETEYFESRLPDQNLYRKTIYITSSGTDTYRINDIANITEVDIEAHNGVVHRVDSVLEPSDLTLLGFFEDHPEYSLFLQALEVTGVYERVSSEQEDLNYVPPTTFLGNDEVNTVGVPDRRFYGYTGFIEPNSVYEAAGITDLEGMKDYARTWFAEAYEEAAPDIYAAGNNENYLDTNNYFNRFVAYHFVNKRISQADFDEVLWTYMPGYDKCLDYTETLAPGQTLCLAAGMNTFSDDSFDGRRQLNPSADQVPLDDAQSYYNWSRPVRNGVLLAQKNQMETSVGLFHELESILTYPRADFRRTRMRLDYAALFPEFMNNAIRYQIKELNGYGIPNGYLTNFWTNSTGTRTLYMATPSQPSAGWWNDFQSDEFIIKGNFDFTIKLPPVPAGLYEVRIGYTINGNRGCAQMYLGTSLDNLIASGIPVDLTVGGDRYGWVKDENTDADYESDKLLRANGFMKAPNSSRSDAGYGNRSLREVGTTNSFPEYALRCIVGTINVPTDGSVFVRFRNATTSTTPEFMMDYIEICPATVYDNPEAMEPRD